MIPKGSKNPTGTPWLPLPNSTDEVMNLKTVDRLLTVLVVELTLSIVSFGLVTWIVFMPDRLRQKLADLVVQYLPQCLREKCNASNAVKEPGCLTKWINGKMDKWTNGRTDLWKERIKLSFKLL